MMTAQLGNDPRFYAAVYAVVFLVMWWWRRGSPKSYAAVMESLNALSPKLKSLPTLLLGAMLSAPMGTNLREVALNAVFGALGSGGLAIATHQGLKAAPGRYGSKPPDPSANSAPKAPDQEN